MTTNEGEGCQAEKPINSTFLIETDKLDNHDNDFIKQEDLYGIFLRR